MSALRKSLRVSQQHIGSMAVIVDPLPDEAARFYHRYGFIGLNDSRRMFLPMKTLAAVLA